MYFCRLCFNESISKLSFAPFIEPALFTFHFYLKHITQITLWHHMIVFTQPTRLAGPWTTFAGGGGNTFQFSQLSPITTDFLSRHHSAHIPHRYIPSWHHGLIFTKVWGPVAYVVYLYLQPYHQNQHGDTRDGFTTGATRDQLYR